MYHQKNMIDEMADAITGGNNIGLWALWPQVGRMGLGSPTFFLRGSGSPLLNC